MRIGLFAVLCVSLLLGACRRSGNAKCFDVCEKANQCDLTERPVDIECDLFCPEVEEMQARMRTAAEEGKWTPLPGFSSTCEEPFNAHLDCWQSNSGQICNVKGTNAFTDCDESGAQWLDCMAEYCKYAKSIGTAGSADEPNCAGDAPGFLPF